jgi:hypothetical protein
MDKANPVQLQKFPYPYEAAFSITSDIDSASISRFRAVHSLFSGGGLLKKGSNEWRTLGLGNGGGRLEDDEKGVPAFAFDVADSFFLVGDPTTFGMYRYDSDSNRFVEDEQDGESCAKLLRRWFKEGQIDSFHAFLHYPRVQIEPLLNGFYQWCESEGIAKPLVWINHSRGVTPTGLCPSRLQPSRFYLLARHVARSVVGPVLGLKGRPLRHAFARYDGDSPGSPYYVNDLLAANGLRYVWLNCKDLHRNRIDLPENQENGRPTILRKVIMDDGIRYWRFDRCYGRPGEAAPGEAYLRNSLEGFDSSSLITEANLAHLCACSGTCMLYTHWTHFRSMPIAPETLSRFQLLKHWRDSGKIWVVSTARLLEWTRRRTFLEITACRENGKLRVEIGGVNDPILGRELVNLEHIQGLAFRVQGHVKSVNIALNGQLLPLDRIHSKGDLYWIKDNGIGMGDDK